MSTPTPNDPAELTPAETSPSTEAEHATPTPLKPKGFPNLVRTRIVTEGTPVGAFSSEALPLTASNVQALRAVGPLLITQGAKDCLDAAPSGFTEKALVVTSNGDGSHTISLPGDTTPPMPDDAEPLLVGADEIDFKKVLAEIRADEAANPAPKPKQVFVKKFMNGRLSVEDVHRKLGVRGTCMCGRPGVGRIYSYCDVRDFMQREPLRAAMVAAANRGRIPVLESTYGKLFMLGYITPCEGCWKEGEKAAAKAPDWVYIEINKGPKSTVVTSVPAQLITSTS